MNFIVIGAYFFIGICVYNIYKHTYNGIVLLWERKLIRKDVLITINSIRNGIFLYSVSRDDKQLIVLKDMVQKTSEVIKDLKYLKKEKQTLSDIYVLLDAIQKLGFDKVMKIDFK